MFSNPSDIHFLNILTDDKELVFNEFLNARAIEPSFDFFLKTNSPDFPNHTKFWLTENTIDAEQTGYDLRTGIWGAFPLYKKGFPVKWFDVKKAFPYLSHFFENTNEIEFACFMRLGAGEKIEKHAHSRQHLIFHMLMNELDNKGCEFTCGEEKKTLLHKGDVLMFDYSLQHASFNASSFDRINLVIDFKTLVSDKDK